MKFVLYIGITIGGLVGSYIPVLLGDANPFSGWSLLAGTIGGIIGLWVGYKIYQNYLD